MSKRTKRSSSSSASSSGDDVDDLHEKMIQTKQKNNERNKFNMRASRENEKEQNFKEHPLSSLPLSYSASNDLDVNDLETSNLNITSSHDDTPSEDDSPVRNSKFNFIPMSSSSDDSDEEMISFNHRLFVNSPVTVKQFNVLFSSCVDRISLAEAHAHVLLDFIRVILPCVNNLPKTYRNIKRLRSDSCLQRTKVCSLCFEPLDTSMHCPSETCGSKDYNKSCKTTICVANVAKQLGHLVSMHKDSMDKYRGKNQFQLLLYICTWFAYTCKY